MRNLLCVRVHRANIHDTKGGIETMQKAIFHYPSVKGCRAIGELSRKLLKIFMISKSIFLNKSKENLKYIHSDGKQNVLLHGSFFPDVYPKTMRFLLFIRNKSVLFLIYRLFCDAFNLVKTSSQYLKYLLTFLPQWGTESTDTQLNSVMP